MADPLINLVDHAEEQAVQPGSERQKQDQDFHIDVMYENQRGWFIFGIPLFSSKALWNLRIDPSPWVGPDYKPSAVNITNAQVPDPSWVWEWKSWYVDMSGDVDEEGWQYSFYFRKFAWHGNHPWFHSFVRRRRWLRKRVKREVKSTDTKDRLFGDAFSIGGTLGSTTIAHTSSGGPASATSDDLDDSSTEEIRDIATLMSRLKNAAIDREKIVAINKFVAEADEELHYLAQEMPTIMSMLIFQNSRQQLLTSLMRTFGAAKDHREEHEKNGKPEDDAEERRIDNLLKAVEAADQECKKLEYWSDIRKLAVEGVAGEATDPSYGWDQKWEGLDNSGPSHP
jgi:hypothetical protein